MSSDMQTALLIPDSLHTDQLKSIRKIQQRAIESDLKMVQEAILLLSAGGIKAVTLEAVGKNSGYSRSLVTRRYGSKERLLMRVLDYMNDRMQSLFFENLSLYGQEALEHTVHLLGTEIEKYPDQFRAYFWLWFYALESSPEVHKKMALMQNQIFEQQKIFLRQAFALEEVTRNADLEMMADFIRCMMRGMFYSWMLEPDFDIVKRIHEFADIHLRQMFRNSHIYDPTNFWGQ